MKNNLNGKVVFQVATACESNIYSPINWKTICLEPDTSLNFWPLNWKTPKQQLYINSHNEIIGELQWTVQFLCTCHAFNYEPLMSWWKTVNNHTALSLREWFQGTLGDDLFPCRLMFVQAVISPTPCVKEICCFARLAGCKPLTPSFCGWKTLRRFSEQRVKPKSSVWHLFSSWNYNPSN